MSPDFKPTYYPQEYHNFYSIFNNYNAKLIEVAKPLLHFEPATILDLACGNGLSSLALRSNFANAHILGVDIAPDMIELAKTLVQDPKIEFQCQDIETILDDVHNKTVDMIFIKSAYHHFEHQITLSRLKEVLSKNGVIAIAERTARSARTYPLPEIANRYWADYFAQPREEHRFTAADSLKLTVCSYGEYVDIPVEDYFQAVKNCQIFGTWALKPEVINHWLTEQFTKKLEVFTVFEEFWVYLYKLTIGLKKNLDN